MSPKRRLMWLGIGVLIGAGLVLWSSTCSHAEKLMTNSSKNGNVLVMTETEWVDIIKHIMNTGDLEMSGSTMYYYKKYELGQATPPHHTMPFDFSVTAIVVPPWDREPGLLLTLRYSRDMGDGFRGHVLLYMMDTNFDMKPDKVTRRTVVTHHLQIFFGGNGITKDTYMFNNRVPLNQNEWNKWIPWLKEQFLKEGEENALEDPDSDSGYRTDSSYR